MNAYPMIFNKPPKFHADMNPDELNQVRSKITTLAKNAVVRLTSKDPEYLAKRRLAQNVIMRRKFLQNQFMTLKVHCQIQ